MKGLHAVAFILTVVGALNWGLVGLGNLIGGQDWNIVKMILSFSPQVESIVYVLVGLSALTLIFSHKRDCRACAPSGAVM